MAEHLRFGRLGDIQDVESRITVADVGPVSVERQPVCETGHFEGPGQLGIPGIADVDNMNAGVIGGHESEAGPDDDRPGDPGDHNGFDDRHGGQARDVP